MIKVLWGTPKDSPSWDERPIIETDDMEKLEEAKKKAESEGYTNFRTMNLDGAKPDFAGTVR